MFTVTARDDQGHSAEVWLVTSTRRDTGEITSTVFARSAKQVAIDYACAMDAEGWNSKIMLEMILTQQPVTVRSGNAVQRI